jgi:hypothetical protein
MSLMHSRAFISRDYPTRLPKPVNTQNQIPRVPFVPLPSAVERPKPILYVPASPDHNYKSSNRYSTFAILYFISFTSKKKRIFERKKERDFWRPQQIWKKRSCRVCHLIRCLISIEESPPPKKKVRMDLTIEEIETSSPKETKRGSTPNTATSEEVSSGNRSFD